VSLDQPTPRRVVKDLPLTRLLPNLLTVFALCGGLTGIRFALLGRWHEAVLAIAIAAIFDVLDGRVARMLNIASKFGAELDSLSDCVSFGVAPALIMYQWRLHNVEELGWVSVLVYAVCIALRLARFNTMLEDHSRPLWTKTFFTGIPSPGAAGLSLFPLVLYVAFGWDSSLPDALIAVWIIFVGLLTVSRLPTMSLKGWRVPHHWVAPLFAVIVLMIAALITSPWLTLTAVITTYIISMPIGWFIYLRRKRLEGKSYAT